ncbi:MAG: diacylglycerol kinase family protein [Patescibacteria group bacterium]|nr:diacylglycerol kinase family protein [Patescibacteria group bacterium]
MPIKRLWQSFKDAAGGIKYAAENERNFRIQLIFALLVFVAAAYFPLKISETLLIVIMVFMVLVVELLNTALEKFTDLLKPRLHYYVKAVKDIMAGAVLLTSLGAVVVGVIIFLPYFIKLFR